MSGGEWFKNLEELRAKALLDGTGITTGMEIDRQREIREKSREEEKAKNREEQRRKNEGINLRKHNLKMFNSLNNFY